jgi:hypothetical protein
MMKQLILTAGMALGASGAAGTAAAAEPPLAGCYQRTYDAAHLAQHKGQLVARLTLAIATPRDKDTPPVFVADGSLRLWVRGDGKSFDTLGGCRVDGKALACSAAVSAAETSVCRSREDGLRSCRVDLADAGGYRVEGRPEGVLLSIPNRLEMIQPPFTAPPFSTSARPTPSTAPFS